MKKRIARLRRQTKETDIRIELNLDGSGKSEIDYPLPFLAHMFTLFSKHGLFDLKLKASGDLEVDLHHLVEDTGLSLGEAFAQALGKKEKIERYGHAVVPMDESLAEVKSAAKTPTTRLKRFLRPSASPSPALVRLIPAKKESLQLREFCDNRPGKV